MYLLGLIKKVADGSIVVKGVDYIRNVLAHINLGIPLALKKLGSSVNKVCGEDSGDDAVLVSLIHTVKTVAEETEGGKYEDALCALIFKLLRNVDNRIAGGDHIVNDNNVLALYVTSEILVSNYGVLTVYYY